METIILAAQKLSGDTVPPLLILSLTHTTFTHAVLNEGSLSGTFFEVEWVKFRAGLEC